MKKFSFVIAIVFVMLMISQVFADVVTTRRINKPQNPSQTQTQQRKPQSATQQPKKATRQTPATKAANSVKNCTPYSENSEYNVGGMNFTFKIKIAGWVNNKCRMDFIADSAGLASNFQELYGDVSEVYSFAPKFRCEFTKQQLASVGDSILEEEARKNGAKMLRDPNSLDLLSMTQNMSPTDAVLMGMLTDGRTCKLLNAGDAGKILDSLLGF